MMSPPARLNATAGRLTGSVSRVMLEGRAAGVMGRRGVLGPTGPLTTARMLSALRGFGPLGSLTRVCAVRHGDRTAIVDDAGEITHRELDGWVNRLCHGLLSAGLTPSRGVVGVLCRNGRLPLAACFAASRAGLQCVWLNTGFSPRQLREVCEREGVDLLIADAEFADAVAAAAPRLGSYLVDVHDPSMPGLEPLTAGMSDALPPAPKHPGKLVLLTSGTTGTPKGAQRTEPRGFVTPAGLLQRVPLPMRGTAVVGPPVFHGTGLLFVIVALSLGTRLVLRGQFDPEVMQRDIERYRAESVCVVPVMIQRMLATPKQYDTSSLRHLFTAGAQLPVEVLRAATERFGPVVHNMYGSTEVAICTIATPEDMAAAPTCVGKPVLGARVEVLDPAGEPVPTGETGRVFAGGLIPFEGYTGGGSKEMVGALMSTGDLGHLDAQGRLHIDGRADDLTISGGENVFPREVEDVIFEIDDVDEVAVKGVPDAAFGQRLAAYVVRRPGSTLSEDDVREHVRHNLARFKIPRDVVFLDELPRTATGKILKRALPDVDSEQ